MKTIVLNLTTFLIVLTLSAADIVRAQSASIHGRVSDNRQEDVPFASVLLLNEKDSAYLQGTVTDSSGVFSFANVNRGRYILLIQHVNYGKHYSVAQVADGPVNLDPIVLTVRDTELKEVSVKASRPVVAMKNNVLSYNAAVVSRKFIHNNALEVLGNVPGILLKDESVQLIGASQLDIAINGKPSSMTMDQIVSMLRSMPSNRVKEVQVMYAPPARYNVKGSLINIVLTQAENNALNGSVSATYKQRTQPGESAGINLQYGTSRVDFDFLYNGSYANVNGSYDIDIQHTFRDTLYMISQHLGGPNKAYDHTLQLNNTFKLRDSENISLVYSGNFTDERSNRHSDATFSSAKGLSSEKDFIGESSSEAMHNVKLDYVLKDKINAGADYTYYDGPSHQDYQSVVNNSTSLYKTSSQQTVNKWMGYFNQTIAMKKAGSLNYGANYAYSSNKNFYSYFGYADDVYTRDDKLSTTNDFNESTLGVFGGFSGNVGKRMSLSVSLKGEFDKMKKDTASTTKTIWNEKLLYPSMNLSYVADTLSNQVFQLSMKSYTNYPSYWEISPATWYTNQYMLVKGNPELRPSRTYAFEFNYIFRKKYVAVISYEYTSGMISQIPYASDETFNTIARNENLDYGSDFSAALVIPVSIGDYISLNPTFALLRRHMKREGSGSQSFDRKSTSGIFQMDNAVTISKKHGVKFTLSGYYYTPMIQTIYDVSRLYDLSCGLAWTVLKKQGLVTLKVNDIFASNAPVTKINTSNQHSEYHFDWDSRQLQLTFKYNFGKPVKDKKVEVDKSRFKRME
jgi:hypothetical protein